MQSLTSPRLGTKHSLAGMPYQQSTSGLSTAALGTPSRCPSRQSNTSSLFCRPPSRQSYNNLIATQTNCVNGPCSEALLETDVANEEKEQDSLKPMTADAKRRAYGSYGHQGGGSFYQVDQLPQPMRPRAWTSTSGRGVRFQVQQTELGTPTSVSSLGRRRRLPNGALPPRLLRYSSTTSHILSKSRSFLRLVKEQRAARTLSIVVGCFIACWLPFFLFSSTLACYPRLRHMPHFDVDLVYAVLTWLGRANSALNPLIYSRFSKEFRRAFKQLLNCNSQVSRVRRSLGNRTVKRAVKEPMRVAINSALVTTAPYLTTDNNISESISPNY